jgi:nitroreductase
MRKGISLPTVVKTIISRFLGSEIRPTPLRIILKMAKNSGRAVGDYLYDALRYFRYSSTFYYWNRDNLASRITALYHSVERGLALPEPQAGFGAQSITYLLGAIDEYIRRYGIDGSLNPSAGALDAYVRFNEGQKLPDFPNRAQIEQLLRTLQPIRSEGGGGTLQVSHEEIRRATANTHAEFFSSRYSIRQFSGMNVSAEDIDAAIRIAQKAPAVCNRQECRVYVVHEKELILKMLAIQGSRGFNHQVNKLLVITNRLTAFYGTGERNQCWIDGGLFAMSLVLGLHAQGLGTCCLNWSKSVPPDKAMRKLLRLPPPEVIIMLVAVGHIPTRLAVARSARQPLESARRHIFCKSEL